MSFRERRGLSSDERALWRRVASSVDPLRPNGNPNGSSEDVKRPVDSPVRTGKPSIDVTTSPDRPASTSQKKRNIGQKVDPHAFDLSLLRHLGRGTRDVDARLDLHGLTQRQAFTRLRYFVAQARLNGHRCVLVITGKGTIDMATGMRERGVLRRVVPDWLRQPELAQNVVGFRAAHQRHGGTGALYVQIRR